MLYLFPFEDGVRDEADADEEALSDESEVLPSALPSALIALFSAPTIELDMALTWFSHSSLAANSPLCFNLSTI